MNDDVLVKALEELAAIAGKALLRRDDVDMTFDERLVELNANEGFLRDDVDEPPILNGCRANNFLLSSFSFDEWLVALDASFLTNERLVVDE